MIPVRDPVERVVLVAAPRKGSPDARHVAEHLEELTRLVDTAGAEVVGRISQHIVAPNPATLIGDISGDLRRGTFSRAGSQSRTGTQGSSYGSRRSHPGHLFYPSAKSRGQAAGGARAARVSASSAYSDVDPPLAHSRWNWIARPRRNPAGDRPADYPPQNSGAQG